jgi:NAD(P)H-dependent FMN reductase
MFLLQTIVASTRKGRKGPLVADWFLERAGLHGTFDIEKVDLAAMDLPLFDEPAHPRLRRYTQSHTLAWSNVVDRADAYVFVMPEYDHGPPASLLNAVQYLVHEWACKAVGFVSYGGVSGGSRSVQALTPVLTTLRMVPVADAVTIPFFTKSIDKDTGQFMPGSIQEEATTRMLDELLRWTRALAPLRADYADRIL